MVFSVLIFYVLTISGVFVLRRKRPDAERPYRAFGYPVIPALYIIVGARHHADADPVQDADHLAGLADRAAGRSGLSDLVPAVRTGTESLVDFGSEHEVRSGNEISGRRVDMPSQLFTTKPHSVLLEELHGENRLRRVLGPVQLSSLGVGAIIGTGIFVLTGIAAHDRTGPALMLSFVVAGMTCIFAALCYAEFASMVPVAGSAYTYAYATLGELFAWIIGWDLILEYAVASSTVAHGWSHYFQDFLAFFSVKLPHDLHERAFRFRSHQRAGWP